jgi:hypothetical protein
MAPRKKNDSDNNSELSKEEILKVIENYDTIPLNNKLMRDSNTYLQYLYSQLSEEIEKQFSEKISEFHEFNPTDLIVSKRTGYFPLALFKDVVVHSYNYLSDRYYYIFHSLNVSPEKVKITFKENSNFKYIDREKDEYIINISANFAYSIFVRSPELIKDRQFILNPELNETDSEAYKIDMEEISHIHTPQDLILHGILIEFCNFLHSLLVETNMESIVNKDILDFSENLLTNVLDEQAVYFFSHQ